MNCINIGNTIAELRKKHGITQQELAEELDVTNKAVSKWESGRGYPAFSDKKGAEA